MSNTQRSIYRIEILTNTGTLVADLSTYAIQRHFVLTRNRAETVDLAFDQGQIETLCSKLGLTVRGLFQPGANDVRISRGSRALLLARINYLSTDVDERSRTISLRAVGYLGLLGQRVMRAPWTLSFTNTELAQIAWSFINQSQTDDPPARQYTSFGITQGAMATGRLYTNTWKPYAKSIADELIALTQLSNSIDFEITPAKVFNTYFPGMGTTHTDIAFSYPGNIKKLSLPIDATQLCNDVYERGSGNGLDQQIISSVYNTSSQSTYQLRETVVDHPQVTVAQTLQDFGGEYLRLNENPTLIPDITLDGNIQPYLGSYWLGDYVPLRITAGTAFADLNGQNMRINQIDVTLDENDSEAIQLKVGYA